MKLIRFFIILVLLLFVGAVAHAIDTNDTEYAKNYLIILVHGIGDTHDCFDNVKKYLEDNGLQGYIYAYEFSDKFLNIEKEGWEFGDRTYNNPEAVAKDSRDENVRKSWEITKRENNGLGGTGKCWLEQAKEDFKIWYADKRLGKKGHPELVPDSVIPPKFIVITHSMAGLSVRSYMLGKDSKGQRYYHGDIEKLITIDATHTGAGGASYVANTQDLFPYYSGVSAASLALTFYYAWLGQDQLAKFYGVMFGYTFVTSSVNSAARSLMNRYKTPALMDMLSDSSFIRDLNAASFGSFEPPKQYLIAGRGVPVPLNVTQGGAFAIGVNPISLMMASTANIFANPKLDTFEGRFFGSYLTMISGYPFFEDGDLAVETFSQLGEGVGNLSNAKKFVHTFRSPSLGIVENAIAPGLDWALNFLSPPVKAMTYIALGLSVANAVAVDENANSVEFALAHLTMKDKTVLEDDAKLLNETLFDNPFVGSSRIGSVNAQGLVLLSGEATPVEVKGYSYTKAAGLPVVIDGKEQHIEAITVKEPPTKITGVLRDFMPKKMQYFQYSENFAAWKDVTVKDEWGNFEIDGLKLAEGQNMIAFRAKNKVGYTSNQHLKIVLNTITESLYAFKMTLAQGQTA